MMRVMLKKKHTLGLVVLFFTAVLIHVFYVPPAERHFMQAVARAYQGPDHPISLKEVVPGTWDRVCVLVEWSITPETTRAELEQRTDIDWQAYKGGLPNMEGHRIIPYPYPVLALAFSQERHIRQLLIFRFPFARTKTLRLLLKTADSKLHCFSDKVQLVHDPKWSFGHVQGFVFKESI